MPDIVANGADAAALEGELAGLRAKLSPRQSRFVDAVVTERTLTAAAAKAGYAWPDKIAGKLLSKPELRRAVDLMKELGAVRARYTVDTMMAELGKGMEFALTTENAAAYVRAVELRGKLTGILVDRLDARIAVGGFVVNVSGLGGDHG
jgi:hypothetical protein